MAEIKNPNQGGGSGTNNSSFLIMMVVMLGVFAGLQYYRNKKTQPLATPAAQTQGQAPSKPAGPAPTAAFGAAAGAPATATAAAAPVAAGPAVVAASEGSIVVENELYKITFSNKGAEVRSWVLKRFHDRNGDLLDLVHDAAAKQFGYPLSLYTYDASTNDGLRNALYVPSATGRLAAPGSLSFHYSQGNVDVTKTFSFDATYVIKAETSVKINGAPVRSLLSWPAGFGDQDAVGDYNGSRIETMRGGSPDHVEFKKVSGGATIDGPLDYAGTADGYFAAMFLPDEPATATAVTLSKTIDVAKLARVGIDKGKPTGKPIDVPVVGVALGDTSGVTKTRVYAGPKSVDVLKGITVSGSSATLEPVVDFGFWGPIAKFLFASLNYIHDHVAPNWGWAIVVLTVIINLVMLPFRYQTMKSGLKMQRIQPQMDAIKAKYAKYKVTDPKRADMNAEIMALQKENGVNMFGGCIPTLLTFPLLFAMLGMLPKVVELREAHWFWLHDLTNADPYHVLPVIMVVSQFLVQFYMPAPGVDPQQQKMMAFTMPLFFGFVSWNYSAGLALYMFVGNVMMVSAQLAMNQTKEGREMRELAAKRARRKVGASQAKTIQGRK